MLLSELIPEAAPVGRTRLRAQVADGGVGCDVAILRGGQPGPVVLVIGAVHGDEYEGPRAIAELAASPPDELRGTVVGLPVVNEPAFFARQRCSPLDGLNLARVFPGRTDGSPTEQIAASLTSLMRRCDFLVDLHAAGTFYTLHPWAGYGVVDDPDLMAVQRRLAIAFGLDLVWGTPMKPGRSLSAAAELGLPAIYIEMTGAGVCRAEDVRRDLVGLRQVLACLGMIDAPYPIETPRWFRESAETDEGHLQIDHPSPRAGVFQPSVVVWDAVRAGQPLGLVCGPGGPDDGIAVTAARDGRVAMLRTAPPVEAGESLAVVVPV